MCEPAVQPRPRQGVPARPPEASSQGGSSDRGRNLNHRKTLSGFLPPGGGSGILWVTAVLVLLLTAGLGTPAFAGDSGPGNAVLRTTLPNGLRVVIVRNPIAPVVTTVVNYLVGSNEAPPGFPGTAHAQEHMMFRGSPGLSADQLADIAAAMGGMFDADTQQAVTQYFFTVPAEDLDVALHIEAIRMRGVLDSEALWQTERGAIEQEVARDLSSPTYVFYTRLLAAMFKGTPYAHDALGTRASFDQTTGAMLQRFHTQWYAPNNAILVIAGDVQPQAALAAVKKQFGGIARQAVPAKPRMHLQPVTPQTMELDTDLPYGLVSIAYRMPGYDSPDYAAVQVLADVLNSPRGALYGLSAGGQALSTGFSFSPFQQSGLGFAAAAFPSGGDPQALLKAVRKVLTDDLSHGFAADLVATAKRHAALDAQLDKNSIPGLAMAWSQALAIEQRRSPEADVAAVRQVSVADVDRVARQYLDPDRAIVAILTPQPSGAPAASSGFGGKESFAPEKTKGVKLPAWAAAALERLSIPAPSTSPVSTTLPNGLRLIVQPASASDTVSVYGHVRNNPYLQTPAGQEGVDDVLDQLFSYGTRTLDRLAYQKALDDIGAYASAGADFSLQVAAGRFERGVQLLADNELDPALPEPAFRIVRRQVADTVAGQLKSPDYLTSRALQKALFPKDDPALRQSTPSTVSSLSLEDVKAYYRNVFRPDQTALVVVGNITPERARRAIEQYFGHWTATGPQPNTVLPSVPPNAPRTTRVPDASRVQDKVILAETLGLTRHDPEYYALELGNHVLGGGFYATRLYQDLREKTGLVYNVSSSFDVGRSRGIYMVAYACDPANVAKARGIVERNLHEMQATRIDDDALRQAKAMLLRETTLAESGLDAIADGFLSRVDLDLPLDEPTLAAHRYVNLSAAQVQAAFAKWLRPRDLVQVTEGPPPH
jgi:zinc protease